MPPSRRSKLILAFAAAALVSLAVAGPASADFWTPESGGSPNADKIDTLYKLILAVAAAVFFGVEGALLYSVWKFKARKGAVAAQIRGNTRLEIGWTVGAAVVLVFLAVFTFALLDDIRNPPNSDANGFNASNGIMVADATRRLPPNGKSLNMEVNGQQYIWRYTYPDGDSNTFNNPFAYEEMVVPTGTTVTLDIRAQDVAHSWWIPKLGPKMDAIPGYTNHLWFKIPNKLAGQVFRGQCAELCGRNHANMTARVRAVSPADFEQWLARRKAEIAAANKAAEQQRKQVERSPQQASQQAPQATP
jgi:cytochrome c oxidase subunit 2